MSNEPALKILEPKLDDLERNANALRQVINDLRKEDGLPPLVPGGGTGAGKSSSGSETSGGQLTSIKSDTFFGKKMQTAAREYLEMRKASTGDGPATPRDIYDALVSGGFKFEAKDEATALISLRALLRKRSAFFTKVGSKYGLLAWYPEHKARRAASSSTVDDGPTQEDIDDEIADAEADEAAA
jgi:hypothetical protein